MSETNYERYFGTPEKAAESMVGKAYEKMCGEIEKWGEANPLILLANSKAACFTLWLESEAE